MLTRREMRARLEAIDSALEKSPVAAGIMIADLLTDLDASPVLPEGWARVGKSLRWQCAEPIKHRIEVEVTNQIVEIAYYSDRRITDYAQAPLAAVRAALELSEEDGKDLCQTCGKVMGAPRVDNGIAAGVHCDACWTDMVRESRSRSY